MKKRTILQLEKVSCNSCASKIVEEVKKILDTEDVSLDQGSGKIFADLEISENQLQQINKRANDIEHGARVVDVRTRKNENVQEKAHGHSHLMPTKVTHIINLIGFLLFIVAIILQFTVFKISGTGFMGIWKIENVWYVFPVYLLAYLFLGYDVIWSAIKRLGTGDMFDENFLMSFATLGAFVMGEFLEAVAVMAFYKVGEIFQDYAVNKSRKEITGLMDLRPNIANLKVDDRFIMVSPETLRIGDIIQVRVGESIPIDGLVSSGTTSLDTKHLTGESRPVDVSFGTNVTSGSINLSAVIEVEVLTLFNDSAVSKIIDFIETNADKKSKQEQFITRFSKIYTPIVVVVAFLVAFAVPGFITLFSKTPYTSILAEWIHAGLVFLVASCPCALVLGVPLAYFAGIGKSAKEGILVKSGSDLDQLRLINHVAFDKTGTITKGNFKVVKIEKAFEISDDDFMRIAAHGESKSNHLIAKSVVNHYNGAIDDKLISNINEIAGQGLEVEVDGRKVLLGNHRLLKSNNVDFEQSETVGTHVYMAVNNKFYGTLIIADEIKDTSYEAIKLLTNQKIKTTMVTGDREDIAKDISKKLNITNTYFEQLPLEKVEVIKQLNIDHRVAFVGDGINDAPVLVTSEIGIAMGGVGSDVAIESADVVLMHDDLRKVSHAIDIAKRTNRIVVANASFTIVIKIIVLVLALIFRDSWWIMGAAVFVDVGASVIATLIATSLLVTKKRDRLYNRPPQLLVNF